MLQANDPRLMTAEELDDYANEFQSQMSTGLYDSDKIDFKSPYFHALPEATQYQLLSTARLRSRLRMGYTKEQLEEQFPDRLEFSKFQINRVAQRNFLTQKLMNMVGLESDGTLDENATRAARSQRVAGSKGSEYVLQKNQNGWTLALGGNKDQVIKIDVDETEVRAEDRKKIKKEASDDDESEEDWEDVPLESKEKPKEANEELPSSLRDFGDQLQRQRLYDQIKHDTNVSKPLPKAVPKESFFVIDDDDGALKTNAPKNNTSNNDFEGDLDDFGSSIFSKKKGIEAAIASGASLDQVSKAKSKATPGASTDKEEFILPPWFNKQEETKTANTFESQEVPDNTKEDDGLITIEQLQDERRVAQFYNSDDEVELATPPVHNISKPSGEAANPFVIDSDGSDKEDVPLSTVPSTVTPVTPSAELEHKDRSSSPESPFIVPIDSSNAQETKDVVKHPAQDSQTGMVHSTLSVLNESRDSATKAIDRDDKVSTDDGISADEAPTKEVETVVEDKLDNLPAAPKYSKDHEEELAEEELKFQQNEDEQLAELLAQEEESNIKFAQELSHAEYNASLPGSSSTPILPAPPVHLKSLQEYDVEINQLRKQAQKEQRDSDEVTQSMIEECQELLRRFGIPYITAPMEAEAQCAALQDLGLVDGIVTDDSDCFLFGGRRIFKNMFANANKYVECYDVADLEREFGLDRSKMIKLAMLLGSDYTDGVTGIGPVTAMEILAEFDTPEGLTQFRDWWESVQLKTATAQTDSESEFKKKFKRNATKIFLPANFPDPAVTEAYEHPDIDSDKTPFEWGVPDLDTIRTYMEAMAGWNHAATEQVLVPVMQSLNGRVREAKQKTLGDFFLFPKTDGSGAASAPGASIGKSKRMTKALEKMGERHKRKGTDDTITASADEPAKKKGKKEKGKGKAKGSAISED